LFDWPEFLVTVLKLTRKKEPLHSLSILTHKNLQIIKIKSSLAELIQSKEASNELTIIQTIANSASATMFPTNHPAQDCECLIAALMQKCSQSNNTGVWHLVSAEGDAKEAMRCFRATMSTLHEYLSSNDDATTAADDIDVDAQMMIEGDKSDSPPPLTSLSVTSMEDERFYLHTQALIMDPSAMPKTKNGVQLLSAIILFNLGLACHNYGMLHNDAAKMAHATRMYELVGQLILDEGAIEEYPSLALASLNNQAYIEYYFGHNPTQADELLTRAATVAGQWLLEGNDGFMADVQLDQIMLNSLLVTMFASPQGAAAAA